MRHLKVEYLLYVQGWAGKKAYLAAVYGRQDAALRAYRDFQARGVGVLLVTLREGEPAPPDWVEVP